MSNKFFNESVSKRIERLFRICIYLQRNSPKKKTDLIEMIVYGCMSGTLNKKHLKDNNKRSKTNTK